MTMLTTPPNPALIERVTRDEIIGRLRLELLSKTGDEHSLCRMAAEKGIFCHGFQRYGDGELRRAYDWIDRRYPQASRDELEELADRWQLARQEVDQLPLACDVQQKERDTCLGWDSFSNEELAGFYRELTGKTLNVVERTGPGVTP